jgi:protocatechuate 3,4-dioxygenase beta subunit
MTLTPTPGQTVGPFFGYALPYPGDSELVPSGHRDAIRLHGTVYDGAGEPIPDALVEIWQADQHGGVPQAEGSLRRDGHSFTGFGRAAVDATGHSSFTTVQPGPAQEGAGCTSTPAGWPPWSSNSPRHSWPSNAACASRQTPTSTPATTWARPKP